MNPSDDSTFFARVSTDPGNSSGYFDSLQRTVVTCEAETLKLTAGVISQLSGSSGANYTQFGGALQVGEYVNVYLVYLNDTSDWRTDTSIINFEHEILGVYTGWDQTLYFDSSRFASNHYPVYGNSNSQSNFQLRRFDPFNWNNGSANSTWYNYDASNVGDWFSIGNC